MESRAKSLLPRQAISRGNIFKHPANAFITGGISPFLGMED